jgi:hypothetical protein
MKRLTRQRRGNSDRGEKKEKIFDRKIKRQKNGKG